MRFSVGHWLFAGVTALALHVALFIGWPENTIGESSPPKGPSIEIASSLAGVLGASEEIIALETPEEITDTTPPVENAQVIDPIETLEPEVTETTPLAVPENSPEKTDLPTVEEVKTPSEEVKKSPVAKTTKAKKKKSKSKKKKQAKKTNKKVATTKPKKKTKKAGPKTRKSAKKGTGKKGSAGQKRGGKGRSNASAGSINAYAGRVRSRILSRRPSSGGHRGTTVISFGLSSSGGLRYARIARSCGNRGLDRRALGAVRGTSYPHPPKGSRSSQLRFSVPFHFR